MIESLKYPISFMTAFSFVALAFAQTQTGVTTVPQSPGTSQDQNSQATPPPMLPSTGTIPGTTPNSINPNSGIHGTLTNPGVNNSLLFPSNINTIPGPTNPGVLPPGTARGTRPGSLSPGINTVPEATEPGTGTVTTPGTVTNPAPVTNPGTINQ